LSPNARDCRTEGCPKGAAGDHAPGVVERGGDCRSCPFLLAVLLVAGSFGR